MQDFAQLENHNNAAKFWNHASYEAQLTISDFLSGTISQQVLKLPPLLIS